VQIRKITGSGGGGSGGSAFHEDPNSLQVNQTFRALYALGEGQIGGLVNGPKSIFINGTPLQNSDGTYNFGGKITWDERVGLPSQPYMPGYPAASNIFNVGIQVKAAAPLVQTTSASNIDQMRVTVGLPNGLCEQKTDANALVGGSVQVKLEKKLSSATAWITDRVVTIEGKTTSAYEQDVLLDRPIGTGTWEVRLTRLTADSTIATLKNDTYWQSYEEIQNIQLEYENTAYVGVAVSAKDLGASSEPTVSFEVYGLFVRVPSNYDPVACTYSGIWDGTFKMAWTDNPAWQLYDLLTHPRYGLGSRISDSYVDKWSFYAASVYNDALVDNGAGTGTNERRFTCNIPLQSRANALQLCTDLASIMHAKVMWLGNRVFLVQDRPTSSTRLLVPADVINGLFSYASTTLADRFTAANITWNNPADKYLQKIENISAGTETGTWGTTLNNAQNTYGYNVQEVAAFGCTRQSQARRHGRWILDSVLNLTDVLKFQMSQRGFDLQTGDVVTVSDPYYAGQQLGGLCAAGSTTTVIQLDRPIALSAGSAISIGLPTGVETQPIVQTSGSVTSVTVSTPFSAAPGQYVTFIVTTAVSPRQFKITSIKQSSTGVIDVEALQYDPNKWSRIETGLSIPAPVFSTFTANNPASTCTNLTFHQQAQYVDNTVQRSVIVGWTPPATGVVAQYSIYYRQALDQWKPLTSQTNSIEIDGLLNGELDVRVSAVNGAGVQSPELTGSYTVNIGGGTTSLLNAPTTLVEANTSSASQFVGSDLNFKWTNPSTNAGLPISLKDFEVRIINPSSLAVIRTDYVAAVAPGSTQTYGYTLAKNNADNNNTPLRTLKVEVRCRDANNALTSPVAGTFSNPAPGGVAGFTATGMYKGMQLQYTKPSDPDYLGVLIWQGTTSTFTPSASNVVFDGDTNLVVLNNLAAGTTYYYKIAAYDTFGKDLTGAGLNIAGPYTGVALQYPGTPGGATLPSTGMQDGDFFYNTSDKHLYVYSTSQARWVIQGLKQGTTAQMNAVTGMLQGDQFYNTDDKRTYTYNGTKWIASSVLTGTSLPASGNVGDLAFNTTDQLLYRWNGTSWVSTLPTTALSGQIQAGQIAANAVAANQIAAGTLSAGVVYAGSISATQITTGTMSAGLITTGTLSADRISGGTLNAGTMQVMNLSATAINAGTLDCSVVNVANLTANKITSTSATALNSYVGTLTVMNSAAQSYIHSNGKAYGDGQWGYILGAEANNSANWMDVQNGTGQIKMHTNGDFLITAGGGAMTLTQNGLTINQVDVIKTANIQGQSVTVPQSAYTAGYATAAGGGVVQTLTVTSSGAPALLIFGTYAYSTHFETLYIQLKRDGNVIFQVGPMGSGYDTAIGGQNMETGTIIDTPTAGTHTYQLYVGDSAGNQASAQARCITYLEVKR
jgi:hypothetical protein